MHRHHCLHRKLSSGGSSVQVVVQAPPYITFPLFPALNNPSCVLILDAARVVRWGCCEHVVLCRKFSSISPGRVVRLLSHVPDDISAPCNNQLLLYSGSSRSGDTGSVLSPFDNNQISCRKLLSDLSDSLTESLEASRVANFHMQTFILDLTGIPHSAVHTTCGEAVTYRYVLFSGM